MRLTGGHPSGLLAPGDFTYDKWVEDGNGGHTPTQLIFKRPGCKNGYCIIDITRGPASHPFFHWDGNREKPTITPSIGCDNAPRCGWHGHIINGEITPTTEAK